MKEAIVAYIPVVCSLLFLSCVSSNRQASGLVRDPNVNVGYGSQDEQTVSGAISTVDVDNPVLSLIDYFLKVPGVRVRRIGGTTQVMIRGAASDQLNPEPLFVIDDIPSGRSFQDLEYMVDVNDIRRVTILRDISSANIYGINAKNGVILIETKKHN